MYYHSFKHLAIIASTIIGFTACTTHDAHKDEHHEDAHHHESNEIVLEPEQAKRFGIETQIIQPTDFNDVISVSGQILNSASDQSTITSPTQGVVNLSQNSNPGSKVSRGQSIGSVSSVGISGGDPNASAKAALNAAKRELDRITPLYKEQIVTRREYEAALANYEAAKAAYSPSAAAGRLVAPMSGIVTELLVKSGDFVQAGTPIATIGKNASLTLRADLPEKFRGKLSSIVDANVRLPYSDQWIPISSLDGKITTPQSAASPSQAGYIPVYFSFKNDGLVSAGSFVDIQLVVNEGDKTLAVPNESIIEQQGNYFIFVKVDEHGYEKRLIEKGISNGNFTKVEKGLNKGEVVVTKGASIVKLAESSGAVPEGHSHHH